MKHPSGGDEGLGCMPNFAPQMEACQPLRLCGRLLCECDLRSKNVLELWSFALHMERRKRERSEKREENWLANTDGKARTRCTTPVNK